MRRVVDQIYMDPKIKDYIIDLVAATREPGRYLPELSPFIEYGASPRHPLSSPGCQSPRF